MADLNRWSQWQIARKSYEELTIDMETQDRTVDVTDSVDGIDVMQRLLAAIKSDDLCVYEDNERHQLMIVIPMVFEPTE